MSGRLKIACVSMIGNESDVAAAFAFQSNLFFDKTYVVAHNSFDETVASLKSIKNLHLQLSDFDGQPQSTIISSLVKLAFDEGADIVCPLDADEFLDFNDSTELEHFLESHSGTDVLKVHWSNLCPSELESSQFAGKYIYSHTLSRVTKVLIYRTAFLKDKNLTVVQGNHGVNSKINLSVREIKTPILFHVPIRSTMQFAKKALIAGVVLSNEKTHPVSDDWVDFSLRPFRPREDLLNLALDYGEPLCTEHDVMQIAAGRGVIRILSKIELSKHNFDLVAVELWHDYLQSVNRKPLSGNISLVEIAQLKSRLRFYESFVGRVQRHLVRKFIK